MKILNGKELADFVKERQAHEVKVLIQNHKISPKLAIVRTNPDPIVDSYMKLKQAYGNDILVHVEVHTVDQSKALETIQTLNNDISVHGIIVQIPLPDPTQTNDILNAVSPDKDVDGLALGSKFDAPTPMAINWLLSGYNIDFTGKHIVIVGHGRLVGQPLKRLWELSNYDVEIADKHTENFTEVIASADILVCATGSPGIISAEMVKPNAVIVDAGVATDSNGLIGDVAPDVRNLPDITITPEKGGVGPLTVSALFENVIRAARITTS